MVVDYRDDLPAREAFEKLLSTCEWPAPELHMTMVEGDKHFVCRSEWMRRNRPLPEGYGLFPWGELTEADRESILSRQAAAPWYPESLSPFLHEQSAEPINSLGLRYQGIVVGWMITHRTRPDRFRYSQLFVSEDVRGLGVGFTLLRESIRLHCESDVDGFYFVFEPNSAIGPWVEQLFREHAAFHSVFRSAKSLSAY
jgi:hypothetical protein